MSRLFLVEWRRNSDHGSEEGPGIWEADHNAGIWWSREAAETEMRERQALLGADDGRTQGDIYEMRVAEYGPQDALRDGAFGVAPVAPKKYICPMKRPGGAPKKCGMCASEGKDVPGECDCCGAALMVLRGGPSKPEPEGGRR